MVDNSLPRRAPVNLGQFPTNAERAQVRELVDASQVADDMASALKCFTGEPLALRLFTRGRHWLCPMREVARHVPGEGRILDVGSGFGLFANYLASGSNRREVTGVEPDVRRVEIANRCSARRFPHVRHLAGVVQDITDRPYDAITILDVLYLLHDEVALDLLRHCRTLVAPDGVLLLKTNDTRPRWKYMVVRAEEWLMVQALAFTFGCTIRFRGEGQYRELLDRAGFKVQALQKIDGWRPVPHRLFVCTPM